MEGSVTNVSKPPERRHLAVDIAKEHHQEGKLLDGNCLDETMPLKEIAENADSNDSTLAASLFPCKLGFFTVYSALGVIYSFLPLYLKQLGMNPEQIGTVMFFRPLGGVVSGILTPYLFSMFPNHNRLTVTLSGLFLIIAFAIGLLMPPSLSDECSILEDLVNSSKANASTKLTYNYLIDQSWMYQGSNMFPLLGGICLLIFSADICGVATETILHVVTMKTLGKDNSGSYGNIRGWGALGHGSASLITGVIMWSIVSETIVCGQLIREPDYHFIFYVFIFFASALVLSSGHLHKQRSSEQEERRKSQSAGGFRANMCSVKTLPWLFVLLCRSMYYAVTQGFLNWHMDNIGASPALIGLCNCVTTTTEFLMFMVTPHVIRRFGNTAIVSFGVFSYVGRFVIFSQITNPTLVLPMEVLEGVLFPCIWCSIVAHLSNQVSTEEQDKVQGLIQALCYLGNGTGFLISGNLTQMFGAPTMFLIFAGMSMVTFLIFMGIQLISWCFKGSADK